MIPYVFVPLACVLVGFAVGALAVIASIVFAVFAAMALCWAVIIAAFVLASWGLSEIVNYMLALHRKHNARILLVTACAAGMGAVAVSGVVWFVLALRL